MKKNVIILLFLFITVSLFSQELLTNVNASWSKVLPGKVICEPQENSEGFAVITDAKNLSFYSNEGNFLWERRLTKATNPFFSVLDNDFLAVVTNSGKRFSLINPDGRTLWEKNFDEKIIAKPVSGRDSRIFLVGEKSVYCFGITGIQKWKLDFERLKSNVPEFLPDGSLMIFLDKTKENKTIGFRITPFGEILEEITFAGEITSTLTVPSGILLTFTDGTSGLFSLKDNHAEHKWLLKKEKKDISRKDFFIQSPDNKNIAYINHRHGGTEVDYINLENGSVNFSFKLESMGEIQFGKYSHNGILVCDNKYAVFYNHKGIEIWKGILPDKKSKNYFNYMLLNSENYFILFGVNWTINAYRTSQNATFKNKKIETESKPDYSGLFNIETTAFDDIYSSGIDSSLIDNENFTLLKNGNYGKEEQAILSQLLTFCAKYKQSVSSSIGNVRGDKTIFETDNSGLEKMFSLTPLFGTSQFVDFSAYVLTKEKDKTLLHAILTNLKENPYDPDFKILNALEYLANNTSYKDEVILGDIINAVYEICIFNGYKAIDYKGKTILTSFLYPSYTSKIRTEARNVLKEILTTQ